MDTMHAAPMRERQLVTAVIAILTLLACNLAYFLFGPLVPAGHSQFPVYAIAILFALAHGQVLLRAIFAAPALSLLPGLMLLSISWSVDPAFSAERAFQGFALTILGVVAA